MISKEVNWVPYELKARDFGSRFLTCELLLARQKRKGFLHHIVNGDEKWIHYDNCKRKKSYGYPGHASTSTAKPNIHGKKLMLCVGWDQFGVIYWELSKTNETITRDVYRRKLKCRKNGGFSTKGMTKLCFSMTMLGHMLLRWSKQIVLGKAELGSLNSPAVFTRYCCCRLPLFRAMTLGLHSLLMKNAKNG